MLVFQSKYVMDVLKELKMINCKLPPTQIATSKNINKEESNVDINQFMRFIRRGALRLVESPKHLEKNFQIIL